MVKSAADPNSQYSHFLLESPTCKNKNRWFRSIITFALTQLKITASTISNLSMNANDTYCAKNL